MTTSAPARGVALGGFSPIRRFFLSPISVLRRALKSSLHGFDSKPRVTWLLNHGQHSGVGNYIANEALGILRLSPFQPCKDEREALSLLRTCQKIAKESYRYGGTSFGIGYFRLDGSEGRFAARLKFYRKASSSRVVFRGRPVYSHFAPHP